MRLFCFGVDGSRAIGWRGSCLVPLLDRAKYPHELSGGMKQRVAIGRALAGRSSTLLMDEPFAALDYQVRCEMQQVILDVWSKMKRTIVFVTHHVEEAIVLADRIFLMKACPSSIAEEVVVQLSRPRDIREDDFNAYRKRIHRHLETEVAKSRVQQVDGN